MSTVIDYNKTPSELQHSLNYPEQLSVILLAVIGKRMWNHGQGEGEGERKREGGRKKQRGRERERNSVKEGGRERTIGLKELVC